MGSQISSPSKEMYNPKKFPSFEEVVSYLRTKDFDFEEKEGNIWGMTMPEGWTTLKLFRTSIYYILDPELKPHYLIFPTVPSSEKVQDFPVTLLRENGTVSLPSFYLLKDGCYFIDKDSEEMKCVSMCEKYVQVRKEFTFEGWYSEMELDQEDLQHVLDAEKSIIEVVRESLYKRAQKLGLFKYVEFSFLERKLSLSIDDLLRKRFEKMRLQYEALAAIPQDQREAATDELLAIRKTLKKTKPYVLPYLEAIGPPVASMPFDEVYQFFDPFNAVDLSRMKEMRQKLRHVQFD